MHFTADAAIPSTEKSRRSPGYLADLGEKTRLIIDAALDAIVGINTAGEIIIWNPQAAAIFGWQEDEIMGQALSDKIVPERFRERHNRGFNHYLQTGIHTTLNRKMEIHAINRAGKEFPIELSILPIKEGGQEFFCAFIRDISKTKEYEKQLVAQKEFSQSLIDGLPGVFYLFDFSGRFLLWNRRVEELSGYTKEEVSAMHPLDFFDKSEKTLVQQRISEVFEKGHSDVEAHFLTKDGRRLPHFFNGRRIEVDGETCVMGMGVDISSRVHMQRELDARKKQLQREMTTAVITAQESERSQLGQELHDNVNQVLTTVKLYVEMMQDGIGDPGKLLSKSVQHLQECITEIRVISKRLSAPTLGNICLTESIKELVESINITQRVNIVYHLEGIFRKKITQELHLAIYRIVQEQLNNIVKYADASYATIAIVQKGTLIYLTIRDDGKGFDATRKQKGIGLNNMRTRAESMGGSFNIQAKPGAGCEIKVCIPLKKGGAG
jgi:PAS domain S-box-containing protein